MKIECLFVGKTSEKYIETGIQMYVKRMTHYVPVTIHELPAYSSGGSKEVVIKKESEFILKKIGVKDFVVLLDERGKEFSSLQFAEFISRSMAGGSVKIVFIVGGAFGVSESVTKRSNLIVSFSKFTFTHQMIRVFLLEQLYRAMTIIRNEPYHHV